MNLKKQDLGILHLLKRFVVYPSGFFFLFVCLFAFTTGPFYMYHFLGTGNSAYNFRPEVIVQLGSSPIPGESALIRCYYTRELMRKHPTAKIIVCQLQEAGQTLIQTDAWKMRVEITRGRNDSVAFGFLTTAHSTREEAMLLKDQFRGIRGRNVLLVTSPEHMYRAVAAFRRAGYNKVGGESTFGWAGLADYRYKDHKLGGRELPVEVGENLQIRYQFWNHLRYQMLCYREFIAFFWYRLRGWA